MTKNQSNDKIVLAHKIRIYPNSTTRKYLEGCFGYSRYCYNKGLELWNKLYKDGKKPNARKVRDYYKRNIPKEDWEKQYSPNILDNAITNLEHGFNLFYKKITKHPKFKKKGKCKESFTINRKNDSTIRIINNKLYLPKFKYGMRLSEEIRFDGVIKKCTITKRANQYYASFTIELSSQEQSNLFKNTKSNYVGIDANLGHYDISVKKKSRQNFPYKELKVYYEKISYYQKRLSRKKRNSNKYNVLRTKIQRLYLRIFNIQNDWLHKFTTKMIKRFHNICIEDLNIKGMVKNKHLGKYILRSSFYRFKLLLTYKSELHGSNLIIADRFYPSTQRCARCGNIKRNKEKLTLSDRTYVCYKCGFKMDRDKNSSYNLKYYGMKMGKVYYLMT
jgi:putative transposase